MGIGELKKGRGKEEKRIEQRNEKGELRMETDSERQKERGGWEDSKRSERGNEQALDVTVQITGAAVNVVFLYTHRFLSGVAGRARWRIGAI